MKGNVPQNTRVKMFEKKIFLFTRSIFGHALSTMVHHFLILLPSTLAKSFETACALKLTSKRAKSSQTF